MYIWICLICHKNSVKETEKFSDSMLYVRFYDAIVCGVACVDLFEFK